MSTPPTASTSPYVATRAGFRTRALRAALVVLVAIVASMLLDRLLPLVGIARDRPTHLTMPPHLSAYIETTESTYSLITDRLGLRVGSPRARSPHPRGLLLIGDEQTTGLGVENRETFACRLDGTLAESDVINAGKPGSGPLAQVRILCHAGLRLRPDVVVWCISADALSRVSSSEIEDIFGPARRPRGITDYLWPSVSGSIVAARQRRDYETPRGTEDFVARIAGIARQKRIHDSQIEAWKKEVARFPRLVDAANRREFVGNILASGLLWPRKWRDSLCLDEGYKWEAWEQMQRVLAAGLEKTTAAGARLAVVFIPGRVQYDIRYVEFLRRFGYEVLDAWPSDDASRFQIALGRWCGDNGVPFADLTREFRAHKEPASLSYEWSGLLTAEGHRLVADAIARLLTQPAPKPE